MNVDIKALRKKMKEIKPEPGDENPEGTFAVRDLQEANPGMNGAALRKLVKEWYRNGMIVIAGDYRRCNHINNRRNSITHYRWVDDKK